jgi:HSP20 family molecular chaperone IbpA
MIPSPPPHFLRSLARSSAPSSALGRIAALARMSPAEYVVRPAAIRLLAAASAACSGRSPNATTNRVAAPLRKSRLVHRDDKPFVPFAWHLHEDGGMSQYLQQPSNSFSALATWRSHPFFAAQASPRQHLFFPFQDLLHHPIDFDFDRAHSPRYEMKGTDATFEVLLELPKGMKASDVQIRVDDVSGGLSIAGKTEQDTKGYKFSSSLAQTFSLDPSVDTASMTAKLDDSGILTISAPKDPARVRDRTRSIPVTATKAGPEPHDESDDIESTKHEGIVEDRAA